MAGLAAGGWVTRGVAVAAGVAGGFGTGVLERTGVATGALAPAGVAGVLGGPKVCTLFLAWSTSICTFADTGTGEAGPFSEPAFPPRFPISPEQVAAESLSKKLLEAMQITLIAGLLSVAPWSVSASEPHPQTPFRRIGCRNPG